MMRPVVPVTLFAALLLVSSVTAQTSSGVLRGTVADPSGAVIVRASVEAINAETGVRYSAATNDAGIFAMPDVTAGRYSVIVEHAGFRRAVRSDIAIATEELLGLNPTLELAAASKAVP